MLPKPIQKLKHTSLRRPTQILIIHILQPKPNPYALKPLKIIENGPTPRPRHINPIQMNTRQNIIQITLIIIRATQIPKSGVFITEETFEGLGEAEFRHDDVWDGGEEGGGEVFEEFADPGGGGVEPGDGWVGGGADGEAGGGGAGAAGAFGKVGGGAVGCAG